MHLFLNRSTLGGHQPETTHYFQQKVQVLSHIKKTGSGGISGSRNEMVLNKEEILTCTCMQAQVLTCRSHTVPPFPYGPGTAPVSLREDDRKSRIHPLNSALPENRVFLKSNFMNPTPYTRPEAGKKVILGCWRKALPSANTSNPDFKKALSRKTTCVDIHYPRRYNEAC